MKKKELNSILENDKLLRLECARIALAATKNRSVEPSDWYIDEIVIIAQWLYQFVTTGDYDLKFKSKRRDA
ncbi:MAG: hypothetical protein LIP09_00665 [Bacteroidales bacterium]|nr:hypothetical protein [Bacteroidales bacterium]